MLIGICGEDFSYNMGNLKTYTMTMYALLDYKMGRKIYSNYYLEVPYTTITSFEQLNEVMETEGYNVSIFLDEIQIYMDAYDRPAKNDGTKAFKNFVRQTRKRGVKLYFTAQSFNDVHRSLRRVTHRILITKKYDITNSGLVICESDSCYNPHAVEITECMIVQEQLFPKQEPIYLKVNPKIFQYYDSEELVGIA